ncbi:hypothetical protein K9N68_11520 [Kovacikia minuta CCNUW1]|uniref:hypothetical protein n=1 Tax=Kovacikia minuta TaxID=2931930 RepID=UPI001CC9F327|nr:hypothetical protein [Kovacikia minuta]UBF28438.1 hypothetical protein K9N68_11520 [Kovacikia minuta CCNUW1]
MVIRRFSKRSPIIPIILSVILAFILFGIGASFFSKQDHVLVPGTSSYTITGEFAIKGTPTLRRKSVKAVEALSKGKDIVLWGSWVGDGKKTGEIVSPVFKAPTILSLFISGYPTAESLFAPGYPSKTGNQIFLQRTDTREKLRLKVGTPGNQWKEISWILPASWRGQPIQLVAIDKMVDPSGWIGISSPLETSLFVLCMRQIGSLVLVPLYVIHFFIFLILGLPLALLIARKYQLKPAFILILGITLSSLVGYCAFWVYLLNPVLGIIFSVCVFLLSIGYAIFLYRKTALKDLLRSRDIVFPLLTMLVVGLGYLSVLYGIETGDYPELLAQLRFFNGTFPPDNVLPKIFSDRLYSGVDPRPLLGEWLSSDRPPLQTGITLFQRPLSDLTGLPGGIHYQILGTIAQCSWVPALWALCRTLQLSGRRIAIVLAFCIFSGFFLFHSVFVWPKLLAAALVVFAFAILLQSIYESRRPSTVEIALATLATALGMLAHGGVVFTVPALILMLLVRPKRLPGVQQILICCVIFGILMTPWGAYQKFYEPPGNRLVKWHLAGVIDPTDTRPSLQTILDSYQQSSAAQIAHNKWENFKKLFNDLPGNANSSEARRTSEYYFVFRSLGILNVGWLVLLVALLKRSDSNGDFKRIGVVLAVCLFSLVFWVLAMFGAGVSEIHVGSYATMLLLFAALAAVLSKLPKWLCYMLLFFHIAVFVNDWLVATYTSSGDILMVSPSFWMVGVTIASTISLIIILYKLSKNPLSEKIIPSTL